MSQYNDEFYKLPGGLELYILYKSLKKYKRHKEDGTVGVYGDEKSENDHEIWLEKALLKGAKPRKDYLITFIHELLHFVAYAKEDMDDPEDYDAVAELIYNRILEEHDLQTSRCYSRKLKGGKR